MKLICFAALSAVISMSLSLSAQEINVKVANYRDGKPCASSFTFDDGNRDNYTIAAPELEKRGWTGTFWLNCYNIQGEEGGKDYMMTWDDVCDMHRKGHEMSNHGWAHKNLAKLSLEEAAAEIEKNDSALFVHTGVRPVTFCYPYNVRNDEIVALASKGRVGTRTFQDAFGEQSPDERLRHLMDKTIQNGEWIVWMTHGITRGYDYFKDPSRYVSFLDYVKERESQIWVATFREVSAYIAERDAVRLDVMQKGKKISIIPSLALDPSLYNVPLTMSVEGVSDIKARQAGRPLKVSYKDGDAWFDFNPHGGKILVTVNR